MPEIKRGMTEQFKTYETQIDHLIACERFQTLSSADGRKSCFSLKNRGTGIVLKSDMKIELGGCQPTVSILLPSNITDSGVFLCGEDIDTENQFLPFGQIVKVAGQTFDEEMYYQLGQALQGLMPADGYMVKKSNQAFLCRISKQAAKAGLSFAALGEILIQRIKERFAAAASVQVFYITSPSAQFHHWQSIAGELAKAQKKIKDAIWQRRGINVNDCLTPGHCGQCSSKVLCDKARAIGQEIVNRVKADNCTERIR